MQEEKAIFNINNTFYRPESKIVRDLGVLGAAIAQKERVLRLYAHRSYLVTALSIAHDFPTS